MLTITAKYQKRLGLPNYSSHAYEVSVTAEISTLRRLQTENARLYRVLQTTVDQQLQAVGFLPTGNYGTITDSPKPASGSTAQPAIRVAESPDAWRCSEKQQRFIALVAKRER